MSEGPALAVNDIIKSSVFWARVTGFPFWPARRCTEYEESILKVKAGKTKQTAVLFLGINRDSGWVPEAGIAPFSSESMSDKFSIKKFKSDRDYRVSVIEAIRILTAQGVAFPVEVMEAVASFDKEYPLVVPHFCFKCRGSEHSGSLMQCSQCLTKELHWHCHRSKDLESLEGSWICDDCCILCHLPLGSLVPFEPEPETESKSSADSEIGSGKKHRLIEGALANGASSFKKAKTSSVIPATVLPIAEAAAPPMRPSMEVDVEDHCLVCGQDGRLLVCDFPGCIKVYHRMCIVRSCRSLASSVEDTQQEEESDTFFCPRHRCAMCQALEKTPCSLLSIDLPATYYSLNASGTYAPLTSIQQRELRSCHRCPFAVCTECEGELRVLGKGSVFRTKRASEDVLCRNCHSGNPRLRLARYLEVAWMRMCDSRLSLPFLSPLLPIEGHSSSGQIDPELDLLSIIDYIRQLKYDSLKSFHRDLNILRNTLINKVKDVVLASPEGSAAFMDSDRYYKAIIGSFDSLLDNCSHYLKSKVAMIDLDAQLSDTSTTSFSAQAPFEELLPKLPIFSTGNLNTGSSAIEAIEGSSRECSEDMQDSASADELMRSLWRRECGSRTTATVRVGPRSLLAWAAFLNEGEMPLAHCGQQDPWSVAEMIASHCKQSTVDRNARKTARNLLDENYVYSEVMNNELLAASYMLDMKTTAARDSLTLWEENRVDTSSRSVGAEYAIRDDTLLILDRLKEVNSIGEQLERRLREDFMHRQRSLLQTSHETLTIGETSILKELKLSNDSLRWKLKHKSMAVTESRLIIQELRNAVRERDAVIDKLKRDLDAKDVDFHLYPTSL